MCRRHLLLLAACAVGVYYLTRTAQEITAVDVDDLYDVWGDDTEEAL